MIAGLRALSARGREGWLAAGAGLPLVAASWLLRCQYLVTVRDVAELLPAEPSSSVSRGASWRRLETPQGLATRADHSELTSQEVSRRLAEGQECWTGWVGERLAHWRWETSRQVYLPYIGLTLRPTPGDLCVVDVYTDPEFRRHGLHTAGTLLALRRARARGLTRLIGLVAWWNRPARRVIEVKTGRRVVGSVGYWSTGSARRYFTRGLATLDHDGAVIVESSVHAPTGGSSSRVCP